MESNGADNAAFMKRLQSYLQMQYFIDNINIVPIERASKVKVTASLEVCSITTFIENSFDRLQRKYKNHKDLSNSQSFTSNDSKAHTSL